MNEISYRCNTCKERTAIGCDGVYETIAKAEKGIIRAEDLGITNKDNDLKIYLFKILKGRFNCKLSENEITENYSKVLNTTI